MDILGPTLAGLTFKVDAARNLLTQDCEKADRLLLGVKQQAQKAICATHDKDVEKKHNVSASIFL
jgi:hypothetical protein